MSQKNFTKIDKNHIAFFKNLLGENAVFIDAESLADYSHDYTENLSFLPEVVLKPADTVQISSLVKYCNQEKIAITPSGARTGLSGGALPVFGGINLSLERMNSLISIDEQNFQATIESGIINQVFQNEVKKVGLFYPPDPSSWGSCFMGGNIALNAGGPKAVKYGVTKDYILNLEVVLPNGEIIWTGANVLKNSTGYNLTQLMIGSEGTLGIVTKAVVKLIPLPKINVLLLAPFKNSADACKAVPEIFKAGLAPSALEFMERDAIDFTLKYVDDVHLPIADEIKAHLLIELDGNDLDLLSKDAETLLETLEKFDVGEVLFADSEEQKQSLWKLRRKVGEAVKSHSIYKEEDTVVPRYHMAELLEFVKKTGEKFGFQSVCYGHVGDGNLHVNIIKGNMSDEQWNVGITEGIREIFKKCVSLGGTISGEHGIGYVQKEYLDIAFSKTAIDLQKRIKAVFDPNGIMNPGKIWL